MRTRFTFRQLEYFVAVGEAGSIARAARAIHVSSPSLSTAITYDLELPADLEFEPLMTLPPYVLLAADHPLSKKRCLSLEKLATLPMVLLDLPMSRDYFLTLFRERKLEPLVVERTQSLVMLRSMVANGFGYGLANIPVATSQAADGKPIVNVALKGEVRPTVQGLVSAVSERRSRVQREFEAHCRAMLGSGR